MSALDIKLFSAFPEADCSRYLCYDCQKLTIDSNDMKKQGEDFLRKIQLKENSSSTSTMENRLFLDISSRLLALYSFLHTKNRTDYDCHDKECKVMNKTIKDNKDSMNEAAKHQDKTKKGSSKQCGRYMVLNDDQRNVLKAQNEGLNVCLTGGSGTGKTEMAKILIKNIAEDKELNQGKKVHIYMVACLRDNNDREAMLLNNFKEEFSEQQQIKVNVQSLTKLMKNLKLKQEEYQNSGNFGFKLPDLLDAMAQKLVEKHKEDRVVFFVDEIMVFGNAEALDWTNFGLVV